MLQFLQGLSLYCNSGIGTRVKQPKTNVVSLSCIFTNPPKDKQKQKQNHDESGSVKGLHRKCAYSLVYKTAVRVHLCRARAAHAPLALPLGRRPLPYTWYVCSMPGCLLRVRSECWKKISIFVIYVLVVLDILVPLSLSSPKGKINMFKLSLRISLVSSTLRHICSTVVHTRAREQLLKIIPGSSYYFSWTSGAPSPPFFVSSRYYTPRVERHREIGNLVRSVGPLPSFARNTR